MPLSQISQPPNVHFIAHNVNKRNNEIITFQLIVIITLKFGIKAISG